MNRYRVLTNPTAGENLNIPQFNNSLGTLALRNSEVYTNQIKYLHTADVLRFAVGKLKYITMVTYQVSSELTGYQLHTMDDFTIKRVSTGLDVRGTKTEHLFTKKIKDFYPSSYTPDAYIKIQTITYSILSTLVNADFFDIKIGTFTGGTKLETALSYPSIGEFEQHTFFILHNAEYQPSYAQLVGDLYQGNEAILDKVRMHFNQNMSVPLLGRQNAFEVDVDLLPPYHNYGVISTVLGKGATNTFGSINTTIGYLQSGGEIGIYNMSKSKEGTDTSFKFWDTSTAIHYPSLPSRFNIFPAGMTIIPNPSYYVGRLLGSSDSYINKDILSSYDVNLINESAQLPYYNNDLNKYMSYDWHLASGSLYDPIYACNKITKYVKNGMLVFRNVTDSDFYLDTPQLYIDFDKAW